MSKNIVIFSDGTGQRGGRFFDEARTNVYKLYRATRCGPDSTIDPKEQLAFYDAGLGTLPRDGNAISRIWRFGYNLVSQATGLGISGNIIDCYAAILRMWEPGDRIFLFGFSRGAYTVRCLAAVLSSCGVPTQMKDGSPLRRDKSTSRAIAKEAVTRVYQHVSSPRDAKYLPQRTALAERFRFQYGSNSETASNAHPHFIGVFDTVASLGSYTAFAGFVAMAAILIAAASFLLSYVAMSFWNWFAGFSAAAIIAFAVAYVWTHFRWARKLEGYPFWSTVHFTEPRMKFYDQQLNKHVAYARHAISIDEYRGDFPRVPWGFKGSWQTREPNGPLWFKQFWFAGNHADIGGGYPENESRLSDIALQWMKEEAMAIPGGLLVDEMVLRTYPSPAGMQHDETRAGLFKYGRKTPRTPISEATLHPSVLERFECGAVLQYDEMLPYRPAVLSQHVELTDYYKCEAVGGSKLGELARSETGK